MSKKNQQLWAAANSAHRSARKTAAGRAVAVQVNLAPKLLRELDDMADRTGKSRSQVIVEGLRTVLHRERKKAS